MAWRIEPVLEPASRTLDAWMVCEVAFDGEDRPWTAHLVGWRLEGERGQVSSPVEAFDPVTRRVRTRSSRVYELRHGPGLNADAFSTWSTWKARHRLSAERDISDQFAALIQESTP